MVGQGAPPADDLDRVVEPPDGYRLQLHVVDHARPELTVAAVPPAGDTAGCAQRTAEGVAGVPTRCDLDCILQSDNLARSRAVVGASGPEAAAPRRASAAQARTGRSIRF